MGSSKGIFESVIDDGDIETKISGALLGD